MNSIIFALMTAFTPETPLPSTEQFSAEIERFSDLYAIELQPGWQVKTASFDNPSPFLTLANANNCTIYINTNSQAQTVWSYLVDHPDIGTEVFTAFAAGHEVFHCLAAQPGERMRMKGLFEAGLEHSFASNNQFEEIAGDSLGLSYAGDMYPHHTIDLTSHIEKIRSQFASADAEHNSDGYLGEDHALHIVDLVIAP
jgi:hypothetical protein